MKYKKVINLLDNTPNEPTKFRRKKQVKINDNVGGTHNNNSQIKFKTLMLKSCLCDYSGAYMLVKGTMSIEKAQAPAEPDSYGKETVFKNCTPFTDFISEINNTQIDDAGNIDVVMPMYDLIE